MASKPLPEQVLRRKPGQHLGSIYSDRIVGKNKYRPRKYPFDKMKVGASFYYPTEDHGTKVRHKLHRIIKHASRRLYAETGVSHNFQLSRVEGGFRIWRLP